MVCRDEPEIHVTEPDRLPPVQLDDPGEAAPAEPGAEHPRYQHGGVPGKQPDGRRVEVVVVVVRDDHGVDVPDAGERYPRRGQARLHAGDLP